jgi:hypothetical protein
MIPLALIKRRVIWSSCINYAFFIGSMLTSTYYLPIYFQSIKNASPLMSGVDLLPSILSTVLAGIITGAASESIPKPLAIVSPLIIMPSWESWILPSLWRSQCRTRSPGYWTYFNIYTHDLSWSLGRISNHHGIW